MPTNGGGGVSGVIVSYTATGAEGVDFDVPIGSTLTTTAYAIVLSPSGVTNVPVLDFPNNPGDRTTTQFRVLAAAPLTLGDKLEFVLFTP